MNYIVVEVSDDCLHCICDNANNIYSWDIVRLKEKNLIDPKDFDDYQDRYDQTMCVVGEVLSGQHDDRFKHWRR